MHEFISELINGQI